MSKYVSEFTSINDINYKVEIITEKGNTTKNFTLSGNPFYTTMDSDGKTMYAPIKSSGATVEMLVNDLPLDIYTTNNQGTKVILTNTSNNSVEWVGYVTPSSYTQDFNVYLEVLQIDCVDGIASLKDVPFRSSTKGAETLLNVIFKILKVCNCYKYLYISDNMRFTSTDTTDIMSKIRLSEANFFDSKDFENQPDDDVAWNCYDVLYEIMQFMGYTITAVGDEVYIIDYDAIRKGINTYFKYSISGNSIGSSSKVTISHNHKITGNSLAETGTSFSLTEVFNQCIVVDEFYEIESVIDGVDSSANLTNITAYYDTQLKQWFQNDNRYNESEVFSVVNKAGETENFFVTVMYDNVEASKPGRHNRYFVLGKIYKHAMISTRHYNDNNVLQNEANYNPMMFSKLVDGKGATIVGYFTQKIENDAYDKWKKTLPSNWDGQSKDAKLQQFGKLCNLANIGNKKLTNYIVCTNPDNRGKHIEHDQVRNYPYFTIKKDLPVIFGGNDGYIILHGTVIRHSHSLAPFPMNGTCWYHNDESKTSIYSGEGYFWSQLKWGNYYWKNEGSYADQGEWSTSVSYFKIFYGDPTKEVRMDKWFDKDSKFYNNSGALWGVDEDGYYIPTPPNGNLSGTIEWTIYANKDTKGKWGRNNAKDKSNSYNGHRPKVMMYRDLDITVGYSDDALNDDAASADTIYTNDVTGYDRVSPMEEISFKICTFDNKTPSYSVVDYLSNGKSVYLDKTYNQATKLSLRQEEHFVVRNVSQYQEPRVLLEINLKNDLNIKPWSLLTYDIIGNKSFIVDIMNIDYKFNKVNMNILEKNNDYE